MEAVKEAVMNSTDIADATNKVQGAIDSFNDNLAIWQIQMESKILRHLQNDAEKAKMKEVTEWLSNRNDWTRHDELSKRRIPNTGLWIMEREEFKSWKNHASQPFICYGIGK